VVTSPSGCFLTAVIVDLTTRDGKTKLNGTLLASRDNISQVSYNWVPCPRGTGIAPGDIRVNVYQLIVFTSKRLNNKAQGRVSRTP
jgi:hypothetical protein